MYIHLTPAVVEVVEPLEELHLGGVGGWSLLMLGRRLGFPRMLLAFAYIPKSFGLARFQTKVLRLPLPRSGTK